MCNVMRMGTFSRVCTLLPLALFRPLPSLFSAGTALLQMSVISTIAPSGDIRSFSSTGTVVAAVNRSEEEVPWPSLASYLMREPICYAPVDL